MENYIRTPKQRGKAKIFYWDQLISEVNELRIERTNIQSARTSFYMWQKRTGNQFKVKMWTAIDDAVWVQRID